MGTRDPVKSLEDGHDGSPRGRGDLKHFVKKTQSFRQLDARIDFQLQAESSCLPRRSHLWVARLERIRATINGEKSANRNNLRIGKKVRKEGMHN